MYELQNYNVNEWEEFWPTLFTNKKKACKVARDNSRVFESKVRVITRYPNMKVRKILVYLDKGKVIK